MPCYMHLYKVNNGFKTVILNGHKLKLRVLDRLKDIEKNIELKGGNFKLPKSIERLSNVVFK